MQVRPGPNADNVFLPTGPASLESSKFIFMFAWALMILVSAVNVRTQDDFTSYNIQEKLNPLQHSINVVAGTKLTYQVHCVVKHIQAWHSKWF